MLPKRAVVLVLSLVAAGCGDSEAPAAGGDAAIASDTARDESSVDSSPADVSSEASTDAPAPDAPEGSVPINGAALLPWLQARSYAMFPRETKVHASSGPHGGSVRTYITPSLDASLAAKAVEHPEGSAMVKELYTGAEVSGWAVAVKTASTSAAGDNWYWYEIFGTTSATKPVADGKGLPGCKGCHSGGKDFVLSPYPLQ